MAGASKDTAPDPAPNTDDTTADTTDDTGAAALPAIEPVRDYFMALQDQIISALEALDGKARFQREQIPGPGGGLARPSVLEGGAFADKAAVQFTHSVGSQLPPAATERNPELAGHGFQAAAISLIVHPVNPMVPTTHMNLRFFIVDAETPHWYFGGGFDLTPSYGFDEDCVHWHRVAADACAPAGPATYAQMKAACDEYFFLQHRQEPRGIGGLFFDDWTQGGFGPSFTLVRSIGDAFLPAYRPIAERRRTMPFTAAQKDFQRYRRGRYVEFNLVQDRGTRYGLQSGRRIESVLASLPPEVQWRYNFQPESGSPEAELTTRYLVARDWLADAGSS